jgi:hypothetical protein
MKLRQPLAVLLLLSCMCLGQTPSRKSRKQKPAPSTKFFVLPIGGAFTLPECEKRALPTPMYAPGLEHWCWQDVSGTPKSGLNSVTPVTAPLRGDVLIHFPPAETPAFTTSPAFFAKIENAKLQAVSFHTNGVRAVDDVIEALTSMYGKPTQQEPVKVENNVGVEFQSQNALWQFTDLTIDYRGVDDELSIGTVWIETPSARQGRIGSQKLSSGQTK